MKANDKEIIVLLVIKFLTLSVISYFLLINLVLSYAGITTDYIQNIFFSGLLSDGKLFYENSLNRELAPIFGARGFVYLQNQGAMIHSSMHGFIFILTAVRSVFGKYGLLFVNPAFATLSIIYFYLIAKKFLDRKYALIAVLLMMLSAVFLFTAIRFYNNVAVAAFFLAGVYYFLKALEENPRLNFLIFSVFASAVLWTRYPEVLFFGPLLLFLFTDKKPAMREIVPGASFFAFALFGLLLFNYFIYGSPTGFLGTKPLTGINNVIIDAPARLSRFIPFSSLTIYFQNLLHQIKLNFIPVLFACFAMPVIFSKRDKFKAGGQKTFVLAISLIVLGWGLFYLGSKWTGYGAGGLDPGSNYSRYLLTPLILIFLLAAFGLSELHKIVKKNWANYIALVLLTTYAFLNLYILFYSPYGITSAVKYANRLSVRQAELLKLIPDPDSIVFTKRMDKIIFPNRVTALYSNLPSKNREKKVAAMIDKLLDMEFPVYFLRETKSDKISDDPFKGYVRELAKIKLIAVQKSPLIYEITKIEE